MDLEGENKICVPWEPLLELVVWGSLAAVTPGSIFSRYERPRAERRSAARLLIARGLVRLHRNNPGGVGFC